MNAKELLLVSQFLSDYADRLANDCCNDWCFPADWTHEEKVVFVHDFHTWNGDPEEFDAERLYLGNSSAADFLASRVKDMATRRNHDQAL